MQRVGQFKWNFNLLKFFVSISFYWWKKKRGKEKKPTRRWRKIKQNENKHIEKFVSKKWEMIVFVANEQSLPECVFWVENGRWIIFFFFWKFKQAKSNIMNGFSLLLIFFTWNCLLLVIFYSSAYWWFFVLKGILHLRTWKNHNYNETNLYIRFSTIFQSKR